MNHQTTLLIISITGAIGWVSAFLFLAFWLSKRGQHRILIADRKAIGGKYRQVYYELKNLQRKTVEPFKERNEETMPEGDTYI